MENIEDFSSLSESEDSLNIAAKNFNKITSAASKHGYREGIEHGSESVFQEGFDKGYEEAFKTAFILGKFKSLMNAMPQDTEHPPDITEILDKTRRGACYMCKLESQNTNDDIQTQSFSQVIKKQRMHSAEVINKLHQYFQPVIKQLNIDMLDLSETQNCVPESSENKQL